MSGRRIPVPLAAALAAATLLAACTSTTSGSGQHVAISTPPASATTPATVSAAPTTTSRTSTSAGPPIVPAPAAPLRTASVTANDGTRYRIEIWQRRDDPTCPPHAYGQPVIAFLTAHPCYNGLDRVLGTVTVNGRAAGFAQSTLTIQTPGTQNPYLYSSQFKQLLLANNTGSITDLLHDGYRLPSGPTAIPAHEAFTVLGQDSTVEIWDAWWLSGPTTDNDPALIKTAMDIFLQY